MAASSPVSSSSDSQSPVIVRPLRKRRRVPNTLAHLATIQRPLGKFQTEVATTWCTATLTWVRSTVTRYRTRDGVLTLISVPAVTRSRTRAAAEALQLVDQLEWVEPASE